MSYQFEHDADVNDTSLENVTVGSIPTQAESASLWSGVRHRGVFDMFQRQESMIYDLASGDSKVSGVGDVTPIGPESGVSLVLRRCDNDATYPLRKEEVCVIGRSRNCDVRIIDDDHLSRRHAALTCTDEDVVIIDLGSANGTWVNGDRLLKNVQVHLAYDQPFFLSRMQFVVTREVVR